MDQPLINRIVEGALLASSQPLTLAQLQGLFPEEEPAPPGSIERALELLREGCADRGVELVEVASGFRFQVTNEVHGFITRLWTERKTRYTRATLETLALIAYRQPITRGEIEQVRGVAVSSNIIQALEEREWIRVIGHRDVPGKPALFGTTKGFLDYFGLKRLDELPPLSELRDLGELEPQLPLDNDGQLAGRIAAGVADPDAEPQPETIPEPESEPEPEQDPATARSAARAALMAARLAEQDAESDNSDTPSHASPSLPDDDADTTASDGEPDTAPGPRAAHQNETENNAVAKTTVAVDEADPEPEADETVAGRSQVNE
ncbi:SMC-Scp complex subunit ScpB [Stenotrophomonas sp. SORGH_AS_0282]|jgi:segregation and condensation protein B|uniref:SMC-Scp complex subunit ScpB n=1 Tax=Stenotrophomonas sp. SORGH_AS_0282 TaxID=3041763 RepID=UPI00277D6DEF|nr:SMC-Scp complex subunit ScpB [Stenotrophomonas sp. SORGH_AS_0282]MDQ1062177.1 segregation and condensation protein B [Stenotrophomonas sp. SORGH_AS_0282]MDQ1189467.1 segregation and condensation protein B [Stenotrophomonas sp. SORGH_AS_0282]